MQWQQWVLIALFAINTIAEIALIGEEREPITRGTAVANLIVNALLVWLVVSI